MLRSKRAGLFYYFTLSVALSFFLVQGNERLRAGDETGTLENLLTADALSDPEAWEKKDRTFHVCVVCGNLVTELNFDECPICFNPLDKYVQVK